MGYANYQYARLHNHLSPSPLLLWEREKTHSAEQQLALAGWTGVPVSDRPATLLRVSDEAAARITQRLQAAGLMERPFAVLHPAAAFATKQWAAVNFAAVANRLGEQGLDVVVVTTSKEALLIKEIELQSSARVVGFSDLTLPEITALLSRARIFVGNDSGLAHMAAAVKTPAVVIFGSSNVAHWRPWSTSAAEVVFEEMECQPCHGYYCEKFDQPECIKRVPVERVIAATERVFRESAS